jgi:hypothetical protein
MGNNINTSLFRTALLYQVYQYMKSQIDNSLFFLVIARTHNLTNNKRRPEDSALEESVLDYSECLIVRYGA